VNTGAPAPRFAITYTKPGVDNHKQQLLAESVIVATGGLSYARSCGSTDLAHKVASDFGLEVQGIRPGLVPLIIPEDSRWVQELAGLSIPVRASLGENSFVENLLFIHKGISGPVVL